MQNQSIEPQELIRFIDEALIEKLTSIVKSNKLTIYGKVEDSTIAVQQAEAIKDYLK